MMCHSVFVLDFETNVFIKSKRVLLKMIYKLSKMIQIIHIFAPNLFTEYLLQKNNVVGNKIGII
jgi:hypothetical protein